MRKAILLASSLPLILCVSRGQAQTWTWNQMSPATPPAARRNHVMAYDSQSDRIVLFGGENGGYHGDTWVYDYNSDTWTQMSPSSSPSPRRSPSMAYDSESDRMVLFGGYDGTTEFSDTWEYDFNSNTWTQMAPGAAPSGRHGAAMAYDLESDRIVLYGGYAGGYYSDTWEYDLNSDTWTQLSPATAPSARRINAMEYDSESDRIVLFGGYNGSYFGDTWEYDLNTDSWTQKSPATPPSARYAVGFAYDTVKDEIVLFGGWNGSPFGDTWEYDLNGDAWEQIFPTVSPSVRYGPLMTFDVESNRAILFGGYSGSVHYNDTWEYLEAVGIELTEFFAVRAPDGIHLKWKTGCEIDNAAWRIERGYNRDEWTVLAVLPSKGNSPSGSAYSYHMSNELAGSFLYYRLGSIDYEGRVMWLSTIRVDPGLMGIPSDDVLLHCIPNPFKQRTTVCFCLSEPDRTTLEIFRPSGRLVAVLVEDELHAGYHSVDFDAGALPGGIYFCRLRTSKTVQTEKLLICR